MSASEDPVSVDTGLVLAEANELHDWADGADERPFLRALFCKKKPSRTCSSSCELLVLPLSGTGLTLPPSSSGMGKLFTHC